MTPTQQAVALSAPILGIVVWWLFRWTRKKVGIASMLLVVYRMKRRIKKGYADDETIEKLRRDADRLDRYWEDLRK